MPDASSTGIIKLRRESSGIIQCNKHAATAKVDATAKGVAMGLGMFWRLGWVRALPATKGWLQEDSRIALLTPVEVQKAEGEDERATAIEGLPEVWVTPCKEALPARIARRVVAFAASAFLYFDWLAEPPMTQRGRVNRDVAKARAELWAHTQLRI